jgi:branched-chain amino acid transport system permease protein
MGISPVRYKLLAFMLGTMAAGLAGSLYAHYMRFVSADDFSFPLSVSFLAMLVLGGMGSLLGPLLGALILGALPELFRPLAEFRILFYALILLLMIRFQPGGLLGEASLVRRRLLPLFLGRPE